MPLRLYAYTFFMCISLLWFCIQAFRTRNVLGKEDLITNDSFGSGSQSCWCWRKNRVNLSNFTLNRQSCFVWITNNIVTIHDFKCFTFLKIFLLFFFTCHSLKIESWSTQKIGPNNKFSLFIPTRFWVVLYRGTCFKPLLLLVIFS